MKTTKQAAKTILGLVILFSMTFFSCKKDGSGNSVSGSNSSVSLLTKSRWTFVKYEYEKPDGAWIADPDPVDTDPFTMGFNTDNTSLEIDLRNSETQPSTWHFSSNNTVLTVEGGHEVISAVYNVNQLTTSTLVITNPNYQVSGYSSQRITFTHN